MCVHAYCMGMICVCACILVGISRYIFGFNSTVYYIYQLLTLLCLVLYIKSYVYLLHYNIILQSWGYLIFFEKIYQNSRFKRVKFERFWKYIKIISSRCQLLPKGNNQHPDWIRPGCFLEHRSPKLQDASPTPDYPSPRSMQVHMVFYSQGMTVYGTACTSWQYLKSFYRLMKFNRIKKRNM